MNTFSLDFDPGNSEKPLDMLKADILSPLFINGLCSTFCSSFHFEEFLLLILDNEIAFSQKEDEATCNGLTFVLL